MIHDDDDDDNDNVDDDHDNDNDTNYNDAMPQVSWIHIAANQLAYLILWALVKMKKIKLLFYQTMVCIVMEK